MKDYLGNELPNVRVGDVIKIKKGENCELDVSIPETAVVSKVDEWGIELEDHYYGSVQHGKYETLDISEFNKDDEKFQKFIDEWNDIGCTSFSREALGEELWNKVIEESKKVEVVNYPPQIQVIVDTIEDYEKEARKTDLSNGITDVSYHNGVYRAIEDILEIIKFSVR